MERMKVEQFLAVLKSEGLAVSRDSLYRYEAAFPAVLVVERDGNGARLYTLENVPQVIEAKGMAKKGMKAKCSDAQSELIAARKLGVTATVDMSGKAIKAALRDLLAAEPALAGDDWGLLIRVYRAMFGTDNMARLRAMSAPTPETIGRRVREVLAEQREGGK